MCVECVRFGNLTILAIRRLKMILVLLTSFRLLQHQCHKTINNVIGCLQSTSLSNACATRISLFNVPVDCLFTAERSWYLLALSKVPSGWACADSLGHIICCSDTISSEGTVAFVEHSPMASTFAIGLLPLDVSSSIPE